MHFHVDSTIAEQAMLLSPEEIAAFLAKVPEASKSTETKNAFGDAVHAATNAKKKELGIEITD